MGSGVYHSVSPPTPCRCRVVDYGDWFKANHPMPEELPPLDEHPIYRLIKLERERRMRIPRGI